MQQPSNARPIRGQVIWFNETKGFGFLKPECDKCQRPIETNRNRCDICGGMVDDVFVHYSAIVVGSPSLPRNLTPGQLVEFEVIEGKGGRPMAHQVRVVKFDDPRRLDLQEARP